MRLEQLNAVVQEEIDFVQATLKRKGLEYARGEDRLEHFKYAAAEQGISPAYALWGMLAKHTASLAGFCKNGLPSRDMCREKITDSIGYLLLLWALVEEAFEGEEHSG